MIRKLLIAGICLSLAGCKIAEAITAHRDRYAAREPSAASKHLSAQAISSLRREHPRLLLTRDDFDRVRERCNGKDALATAWSKKLRTRAERYLDDPPVKFAHPLLASSREAITRVLTLAGMYRLSGDERFARRATDELLAIAKFPDWNPQDFLATGEMSAAVAIGYDWLFDSLSPDERAQIKKALIEKSLGPGSRAYRDNDDWTRAAHNWNFVCNGGLMLAALAVAEDEPKLSAQVIAGANDSIRVALRSFAPDGGWEEGPSYWNYATRYLTYALAGLDTATGSDGGLSAATGLSRTGLFRISVQGPTGKLFNFGDCDERTSACPQLFWMAHRFKQPAYAEFEASEQESDPTMLDLLWYQPGDGGTAAMHDLPKEVRFRGVNVVSIRSAWLDRNATFVAMKGGSNEAQHGHLDAGTFVLDALGERWAIDLGAENYNLPGYSDTDKRRWTFYRAMTMGHNTVTIDDENQDTDGVATIVGAESDRAVADLSRAYRHKPHAWRGVKVIDDKSVLIQDEVLADDGKQIVWSMHTRAKIVIDRSASIATLEQNGKQMRVEILSPAKEQFEIESANPKPPQSQQPDVHKLVIRIPRTRSQATIAVLISPVEQASARIPARAALARPRIEPLSDWLEDARSTNPRASDSRATDRRAPR